jgi:hypothetical protein
MKNLARFIGCALALALAATACGGASKPAVDVKAPTLVSSSPSLGAPVPVDAVLTLRFSEPVKRSSLFWTATGATGETPDSILLVAADDRAVVVKASSNEADTPPVSDATRKKLVPVEVTLSDDRTEVRVRPLSSLAGDAAYFLYLSKRISDDANNRFVNPDTKKNETMELRVTTAPLPDDVRPTATLLVPAAHVVGQPDQTQPLDLPRVQVLFSEPMDVASLTAVRIRLVEEGSGVTLAPTALAWDGNILSMDLPAHPAGGDCVRLCPARLYVLSLDAAVTDLAGNAVQNPDENQYFLSAACLDTAVPRLAMDSVAVQPSDVTAVVTWRSDEASTSRVEFDDCGAATCPANVDGPVSVCGGNVDICALPGDEASFACTHMVRLTGLVAGTSYAVRVLSFDVGGRGPTALTASFTTLPPQPRLALTELFATPQGLDDANKGKFVEIQNVGNAAIDLAPAGGKAWTLARCGDADCSPAALTNKWSMKPSGTTTSLAAGAFAVAGGKAFTAEAAAAMGVPAEAMLLVTAGTATTLLANGLTSTVAYRYALLSPDGAVVSTYGAHLGKPDASGVKGHAFERKDPAGDDIVDNWAVSSAAVAGAAGSFATPGRRNSVTP